MKLGCFSVSRSSLLLLPWNPISFHSNWNDRSLFSISKWKETQVISSNSLRCGKLFSSVRFCLTAYWHSILTQWSKNLLNHSVFNSLSRACNRLQNQFKRHQIDRRFAEQRIVHLNQNCDIRFTDQEFIEMMEKFHQKDFQLSLRFVAAAGPFFFASVFILVSRLAKENEKLRLRQTLLLGTTFSFAFSLASVVCFYWLQSSVVQCIVF